MEEKQYYRVSEVAKLLSIAESTVWLYLSQKKLHALKLSARVTVVDRKELNRFIEQAKERA